MVTKSGIAWPTKLKTFAKMTGLHVAGRLKKPELPSVLRATDRSPSGRLHFVILNNANPLHIYNVTGGKRCGAAFGKNF